MGTWGSWVWSAAASPSELGVAQRMELVELGELPAAHSFVDAAHTGRGLLLLPPPCPQLPGCVPLVRRGASLASPAAHQQQPAARPPMACCYCRLLATGLLLHTSHFCGFFGRPRRFGRPLRAVWRLAAGLALSLFFLLARTAGSSADAASLLPIPPAHTQATQREGVFEPPARKAKSQEG